jgi:hydrogenase maturation factor
VTPLTRYGELPGSCTLADGACGTCTDAGVPVRVLLVQQERGGDGVVARCEDRTGAQAEVAVDFIPGVRPGDVLLVHAGVAIARLEEA